MAKSTITSTLDLTDDTPDGTVMGSGSQTVTPKRKVTPKVKKPTE